jgi:hypothetical protein
MKNLKLFYNTRSGKTRCSFSEVNTLFFSALLIIILCVITAQNSSAQNLKEYSSLINSMTGTNKQVGSSEAKHLKSLVFDLQSKIYVNNHVSKTFGAESPACIDIDAKSTAQLYENNPLFSQVELITIKLDNLSDLNFVLDLSKLTGFRNLKYIQFFCSFNCDPAKISGLYQEISKTGIIVFYRISLPE